MSKNNQVSSYRWVILLAIVPIIIASEIMWLSLAPISSTAEGFYGVSSMSIALFAMSYLIMYIFFSIPASWVVDKYGYKTSLIIGAVITAVFGLIRALYADNFTIVIISQFIIAIGQPFLLNISTKVPANWFPMSERSTAAGILTLAQYIGFAIPMLLAPMVAESSGIPTVFMIFAIIAVVAAFLAILLAKENPPVAPPGPSAPKEDFSLSSLKKLFTNKSFLLVMIVGFVCIGIFNTILTLIESILTPRGITSVEAGLVGAIFVVAGIVGAVVLPLLSDKYRVRTPLFVIVISLLIPVYLGFTFVSSFTLVAIIAGIGGFGIMGVAPILFQHGSEVAYPVQEGTSLGMILLMGQISGALFIYLFEAIQTASGSIMWPMLMIVALTVATVPFALKMKESDLVQKA